MLLILPLAMSLTGCLHFGNLSEGCLEGFVRTEYGCQSLNMLSNSELESANARLESLQTQNETQADTIRETQRLIARLQASRRGLQDTFERNQMSPSSIRNLSNPSSFSFYNNNSSQNYQRNSVNSAIFGSGSNSRDGIGFSSGNY
ncbi:hypothetical protein [Bdellovibrio sp. HCB337]|uniref:hypothetical protein n=1 Tax=Bdellovibrio sp. HCB337 TaxID=3394358 RepID=UPI0039A4C40D